MSRSITKNGVDSANQRLPRIMGTQIKKYWHEALGYQKLLYFTGFLLLASAVFHTVVLIVSGGTLHGDVSFRKAISFGEAFGLTAISLAWFLTFVPKKRVVWLVLSSIYAVATFVEVFLVIMQIWRRVPSHFNSGTPFDAAVFALMGVSISLHAPLILGVLVGSAFFSKAPTSLKWAVTSGILLLLASLAFGFVMIANSSHTIGLAGQMKVPHALALHAVQVLPLLAWLLSFTGFRENKRNRIVIAGIASYAALVGITSLQAFNGLAMADLSLLMSCMLFSSAMILGSIFLWALNGLRQR